MSQNSGTVLLVQGDPELSRATESDLALAGFEVVSVSDPAKLPDAARGRAVAAIVVPQAVAGGAWRRWKRDPGLRRVPVVGVAPDRPQLPVPWPFGAFRRADAYVSAADLERRGAAADAVRAAAREAGVPPTGRERLGEALWYLGSVLYVLGAALAIVEIARTRTPAGMLLGIPLLGSGRVLLDVGGCVGLAQRPRLRPATWFWIALVLLVVFARR